MGSGVQQQYMACMQVHRPHTHTQRLLATPYFTRGSLCVMLLQAHAAAEEADNLRRKLQQLQRAQHDIKIEPPHIRAAPVQLPPPVVVSPGSTTGAAHAVRTAHTHIYSRAGLVQR